MGTWNPLCAKGAIRIIPAMIMGARSGGSNLRPHSIGRPVVPTTLLLLLLVLLLLLLCCRCHVSCFDSLIPLIDTIQNRLLYKQNRKIEEEERRKTKQRGEGELERCYTFKTFLPLLLLLSLLLLLLLRFFPNHYGRCIIQPYRIIPSYHHYHIDWIKREWIRKMTKLHTT